MKVGLLKQNVKFSRTAFNYLKQYHVSFLNDFYKDHFLRSDCCKVGTKNVSDHFFYLVFYVKFFDAVLNPPYENKPHYNHPAHTENCVPLFALRRDKTLNAY